MVLVVLSGKVGGAEVLMLVLSSWWLRCWLVAKCWWC